MTPPPEPSPPEQIAPEQVARFAAALDALVADRGRIGLAVSGGPDSLALLLLAAAARPGRIAAATVDHGLRPESAGEARMVAALAARLDVPHRILAPDWTAPPRANVQAEARRARYRALGRWASKEQLREVATGHHADDQAETLLLRLARGAGLSGLSGVRPATRIAEADLLLVRPLLDWRRRELAALVAGQGLVAATDASNADPRYDRARMRAWLGEASPLDPERIAASARNLAEAAEALDWAEDAAAARYLSLAADGVTLDPADLPRDMKRRLALRALAALGAESPPGPALARLLDQLERGGQATLAGVQATGGATWRFTPAPPRRPTRPPSS